MLADHLLDEGEQRRHLAVVAVVEIGAAGGGLAAVDDHQGDLLAAHEVEQAQAAAQRRLPAQRSLIGVVGPHMEPEPFMGWTDRRMLSLAQILQGANQWGRA